MTRRLAETTIATDATLADIVAALDRPVEYVRRIPEKLERCRRVHGDAQVRIGIRGGRTSSPHYLIEYQRTDPASGDPMVHVDAAYSGITHRQLASTHVAQSRDWSREEMNITAVAALIGRLRDHR